MFQLVPETVSMSAFSKDPKSVAAAVADAPVMVMNRSETLGMLVNPKQWNELILELKMYQQLAESRRISIQNTMDDSWVSGDEMDRLMVERGVFTAEELEIESVVKADGQELELETP